MSEQAPPRPDLTVKERAAEALDLLGRIKWGIDISGCATLGDVHDFLDGMIEQAERNAR